MRRIAAVTGATGFIGTHLASALLGEGWIVRGITRSSSRKPLPPGVDRVESSFDAGSLVTAGAGAEVVFHLAARLHGPRASLDAANVDTTREVVRASRTLGARLVHVSSLAAVGPASAAAPRAEHDEPRPITAYGASKLAAEQQVRNQDGWWTILRPPLVYGPGDRAFLPLFKLARRGIFIRPMRPNATYSLIHVHDLVRGLIDAAHAERARHEIIFLAHRQHVTADQIVRTLAQIFGRSYHPLPCPLPLVRAAARLGDVAARIGLGRLFDSDRLAELMAEGFTGTSDRARELLNFEARIDFEEGFRSVADWYRTARWIS